LAVPPCGCATSRLTILPLAAADFETAAERLDPLRQLGLVVIDYLQLVPSPRGVARSTQDEDLALVLQRLKALRSSAAWRWSWCRSYRGSTPSVRTRGRRSTTSDTRRDQATCRLGAGIYREEMYNPGHGVDGRPS